MGFLLAIFLCLSVTLATETTYFGLRVSKSCKALVRDNLLLGKDIGQEVKNIYIANITDSQGDWWNRKTVILRNVRAENFTTNFNGLKMQSCKMLPTGLLQVVAQGSGLVWKVTFDFEFQLMGFTMLQTTGSAEVASELVEFVQNYLDGEPDTNVYVRWNLVNFKLDETVFPFLLNYVQTVLVDQLSPKLTLRLNMHFSSMSNGIIKSYEEIITHYRGATVKVRNTMLLATEAVSSGMSYGTFGYGAKFVSAGLSRAMAGNTTSAVEDTKGRAFDYQVCYAARAFEEYFDFMMQNNMYTVEVVDPSKLGLESQVGFYKGLVPDLANRFADDVQVKIMCHTNIKKNVEHQNFFDAEKSARRANIADRCEFSIRSTGEAFLTLDVVYNTTYHLVEVKSGHVAAVLMDPVVRSVAALPRPDFQAKFLVLDLANKLAGLLDRFVVADLDGFFVSTVRSADYAFLGVDQRKDDVCLLYKDTA